MNDLFSRFETPSARKRRARPIPRSFSFPWGSGQIIEEVAHVGAHHEPCIQVLRFDDGREIVRFCSYTLKGRFERNSWIAGHDELAGLQTQLDSAPRIREILAQLLSPAAAGLCGPIPG